MIRILIIEDEKPAATRLTQMLELLEEDIQIVGHTDSILSTVKWLNTHPHPDLMMVDIQLGDGLSFNIFKEVKINTPVIFTTAYDQYAIKAFDVNSIDYLLKPVKEKKLKQSIEKYKDRNAKNQQVNINSILSIIKEDQQTYKRRFMISIGSRIKSINTEDIIAFYVLEKSTFALCNDGRNYPVDFSLERIEELINPNHFFRINRQSIINHKGIANISIFSKSRIKIETHPTCEVDLMVSSKKSHAFRQWLDQ